MAEVQTRVQFENEYDHGFCHARLKSDNHVHKRDQWVIIILWDQITILEQMK